MTPPTAAPYRDRAARAAPAGGGPRYRGSGPLLCPPRASTRPLVARSAGPPRPPQSLRRGLAPAGVITGTIAVPECPVKGKLGGTRSAERAPTGAQRGALLGARACAILGAAARPGLRPESGQIFPHRDAPGGILWSGCCARASGAGHRIV